MFGIGTKQARLHVDSFTNMLGEDEESWGLSHNGIIWHAGMYKQYTDRFEENITTTIGLYFDGFAGTLTYYKDGVCLNIAFNNLNKVDELLYPMVCSTGARTEMVLGCLKRDFINLADRCRTIILRQFTHKEHIEHLCIPPCIKDYILDGFVNIQ